LATVVNPLLAHSPLIERDLTRSMRLFLLKTLERQRGVAFVRSAMQQPPIMGTKWMKEWLKVNELGLIRFMGANKLPQHNPFNKEVLYPEALQAVAGYLVAGDFAGLEAFVVAHAGRGRAKSALALALFHEVGLLPVLPDATGGKIGLRVAALVEWVLRSPSLESMCKADEGGAVERQLLAFCSGAAPRVEGIGGHAEAVGFMALDKTSSPEKVVTVRFFVHLAARAMAAAPGDQLYFFRCLLCQMPSLKGTKFPTMADDALYMVQKALMEAGDSRGAKRWYTCPNGHPFAIGNCGGATQESKCPECGEAIGGSGHNLLSTNKAMGAVTGTLASEVSNRALGSNHTNWHMPIGGECASPTC
jgi:hypothetical protein